MAAAAGRPPGRRAAARRRHRRAATGRRRKGGRRPRVGDENSMLAAERRDRESADFGEMKREAGGLGEFLLCPQGNANKKKLTG